MQSGTEDHLARLRDRGGGGAKVSSQSTNRFDRDEAKMMHGGIDLLHSNNCVVVISRWIQYGAGVALSDVSPAR